MLPFVTPGQVPEDSQVFLQVWRSPGIDRPQPGSHQSAPFPLKKRENITLFSVDNLIAMAPHARVTVDVRVKWSAAACGRTLATGQLSESRHGPTALLE